MSVATLLILIVIGLVAGTLIGTVGVGGVLLVPALVLVAGLDIHEATPIATLSFLFTGTAGTIAYQRQGRIEWDTAKWLLLAAIPGAVAGAVTNIALPATAIAVVIAGLLAVAALQTLRRTGPDSQTVGHGIGIAALIAVGAVVGFGSALTGTGGPVLLIPVLLLAGASAGLAVSSSQPIQIPIAVFGAASFLVYGSLDWQLAIVVGIAQGIGALLGARLSDRLPVATIRMLVGWALAASAVLLVVKVVAG